MYIYICIYISLSVKIWETLHTVDSFGKIWSYNVYHVVKSIYIVIKLFHGLYLTNCIVNLLGHKTRLCIAPSIVSIVLDTL